MACQNTGGICAIPIPTDRRQLYLLRQSSWQAELALADISVEAVSVSKEHQKEREYQEVWALRQTANTTVCSSVP
jgi:hypothetical protein